MIVSASFFPYFLTGCYYHQMVQIINNITMQTFKEISFQNYIELRFNPKNLEEASQQQALIKYKRNAQLLAQIFSFEQKPKETFEGTPVITENHLEQLEQDIEKQRLAGEDKCREIDEKSKSYAKILKQIKEIKSPEEKTRIIEELKQADLYDQRHPYFAEGSPFFMNSTDEEVLEVKECNEVPQFEDLSIMELK